MVAARSANPAPDVRIASELGSLLLLPAQIGHPRWRLDASVRMVPALHHFKLSLDRFRARVCETPTAAICPPPLRERLVPLLGEALAYGTAGALHGVAAMLALGRRDAADLAAMASRRYLAPRLDALVRTGTLAGELV